jgi:hypothetical protein
VHAAFQGLSAEHLSTALLFLATPAIVEFAAKLFKPEQETHSAVQPDDVVKLLGSAVSQCQGENRTNMIMSIARIVELYPGTYDAANAAVMVRDAACHYPQCSQTCGTVERAPRAV